MAADLGDVASLAHGPSAARIASLLERPSWQRVGLVNNAAHPGLLGPIERLDVDALAAVFATNVSAPIWLMGVVMRHVPRRVPVRIVNVSTRAAVRGYAGLGAYGGSKAALRMASMVLAAELEDPALAANARNVKILSYEPGTVDTAMQSNARSSSEEILPSIDLFRGLAVEGKLVPPAAPAGEIVEFLEGNADHVLTERRYGVS
jgi:benzil reductase ((S)-benzoin forming)